MITIERNHDGSIDYAAIGSELDHCRSVDDLVSFASKFYQSTDSAMAALATFATFRAKAVEQRLRGNIETALNCERNADTVIRTSIRPENRW